MITLKISSASALTLFGLFLTVFGLILTIIAWSTSFRLSRDITEIKNAINTLQNGAIRQILRQQDAAWGRRFTGEDSVNGQVASELPNDIGEAESSSKNGKHLRETITKIFRRLGRGSRSKQRNTGGKPAVTGQETDGSMSS